MSDIKPMSAPFPKPRCRKTTSGKHIWWTIDEYADVAESWDILHAINRKTIKKCLACGVYDY